MLNETLRAARLRSALVCACLLALASTACRQSPPASALAADVAASARLAPLPGRAGRPLAVVYSWRTGPSFQALDRSLRAFVQVVSEDGAALVQDDHWPQPSSTSWSVNQTYSYTRVIFPPKQFPGQVEVRVGLGEPDGGRRLTLRGDDLGQATYRVAATTLLPQAHDDAARYGQGFLAPDGPAGRLFVSSRWTLREAHVSLANPFADALLLIQAETYATAFASAPEVTLELGSACIGQPHVIRDSEPFTLVNRVNREALGEQARCDLKILMSATLEARHDARRPGLQVHEVALLPLAELPPEIVALASP